MKELLTIVIPTWNNPDMLRLCVESLFVHTKFPFKVIIVDNGCKGEVKASLPEESKNYVEVLEPDTNLGWSSAHMLALEECDTKFYCMLNDDVVFIPGQPDFWRKLTGHLVDDVAAVGPSSNFVAGNQSIQNNRAHIVCDSSFLIGFCMVIHTDIFREVGGLDPSLPGGDDLDLSIRLRKAGYVLRVEKRAYLHHYGQQTGTRIHGDNWDSKWSQEVTNNALIAKHGIKLWQDCFLSGWKYPDDWKVGEPQASEDEWYAEHMFDFAGSPGLNVGCGGNKLDGAIGVDVRPPGELGDGGERDKEAATDIQADAADIPLEDDSQQYIVAAHVLEHMIDPIAALNEWHRLLVPGGSLFLTVPHHTLDNNAMLLDYTHLHAFNDESLNNLLTSSGFVVDFVERAPMATIRAICRKMAVVNEEVAA
mgnify:FL=1